MTDRDELADRLDAVGDEIGATADTFDDEPLTAAEKRELAALFNPDAPDDPDLGELKEQTDVLI